MKNALSTISIGVVLLTVTAAAAEQMAAPLVGAAERSDVEKVRSLLQQDCDVDARQADGMSALHWAVYRDDRAIVELLIEAGADVGAVTRYGVAPLSIACANGSEAIVALLLKSGADPDTTLRGGETALMTAARTGRLGPVRSLIEQGADVNARETNDQTALMWAAAEGHAEVLRHLMEAGGDYQMQLDSGFTPLLFAAREGKMAVVKLLLSAGLDVNEATQPRRTLPGGPGRGVSPLVIAIENGHFELAALLLEVGADPNDERSGLAPLHLLVRVRKPDSGDDNGMPPPDGSGKLTSLDMVRSLVEHGADVNARLKRGPRGPGILSRRGATPFLLAADTADSELMRLLLELGADCSLPNAENSTPLMAAAGLGTLAPTEEAGTDEEAYEAARMLLDMGADVNAVDDSGETAMHGAAYKNLPQIVQLLSDRGADPSVWNRPNKHGWTPLRIAQGHRPGNFKPSPETIEVLVRVLPELAAGLDAPPPEPKPGY